MCVCSSLLTRQIADELPRLVHHLGPRYTDAFQDLHMVKFLTYEASTSFNMFLALKSTIPLPKSKLGEQTSIVKALKKGMGIPETSVIFTFSAAGAPGWGQDKGVGVRCGIGALNGEIEGDAMNFNAPEQSTIVNVVAYRTIALDFSLWSRTRKEIQCTHFEHFTTLLQTSKYKIFNMKQRLSSMGLVRKLLFALQADWYSQDVLVPLLALAALKVAAMANFDKDDTIKPMVSYLAANLPETSSGDRSPHSNISRFELKNPREKAEQVLLMLTDILLLRPYYLKFISALPMARICLLLGDRPSSFVATQILNLVGLSIQMSSSFNRKFELISGWLVLKTVLPSVWDPQINTPLANGYSLNTLDVSATFNAPLTTQRTVLENLWKFQPHSC